MDLSKVGLYIAVLACTFCTAVAVQCYECNVWKAGYGHMCDNPRVREDCTVCMKTETKVHMGYYKNTPRTSVIESRICAKSNTIHFSNECHTYDTSDGTSTRCYCDSDRCNSASSHSMFWTLPFAAMFYLFRHMLL